MDDPVYAEAHSAVSIGIAECFMCQPKEMPWEDRADQLATAAIEAMQIHFATMTPPAPTLLSVKDDR